MSQVYTVKMPDIGEGVVEGQIVEWVKKVGEAVAKDEAVVVIVTDKATVELPAPYPGKISKHYYQIGEMAVKDHPLYDIEIGADVKVIPSIHEEALAFKKEEAVQAENKTQASIFQEEGVALAVPYVRRMAKDLGLDLSRIQGTGKRGEITENDLRQYIKSSSHETGKKAARREFEDDEEVPLLGIRHFMVKKMSESHHHIPPFSYFEQAEATRLVQLRERLKEKAEKENIRLTYMPFFIRALSLTIKKFPSLNSSLDLSGQKLYIHKHHHIGLAMATSSGLIVPVLKDVQNLNLEQIIRRYDALKIQAMENRLEPKDMKGATITISNYGVLGGGGLWATPVINFPEVAILAVAKIQKQPVAKKDQVAVCDVLDLSWSFDHRVIDGDLGASISHFYSELIKNPSQLI